ncbi:uncharacterized protein [Montipora capricornis]|uniref:uncharacterized protein n=1 Tax=Montipora capricornis TaxID=246305 RepID=UPI0035F18534
MAECDQDVLGNEEIIVNVKRFLRDGCGCSRGVKGGPCCQQFSEEVVLSNLNNCLELTHAELDLVILANIQAVTKIEVIGEKRKERSRCSFLYQNLPICKDMFLHLYGLSYSRFRRLKEHYEQNGLSQRIHGNSKRLPHNTLQQAINEDVKNFLTNYVEENAVLLPERIPGFKKDDIRLLSSSETKMNVWRMFKRTCEESGKHAVCYTTFVKLWEQFHPDVVVAKPMTDLCLTCQQNTSKLLRSANLPDREKSECVIAQQEHLTSVKTERDFYNKICLESQSNFKRFEETIKLDERNEPCSIDTTIHYSFDFAQQIHIPSNPMQPGPIYFKTPRKCGIFGVMCEAIPRQVNYLIDEASDVGKGANTTVSFVHHYFHDHGLGETSVHLHADNCTGQNKNNCFLWYLSWRVIHQLHHSISYSFLIAGHTKFGPDRCFGLIKKSYKVNYVSSLYEFAQMVETSSSTGVNKAQLVGTHDGRVIVPVYNWSAFLEQYFVKVPNIKRYHHFRITKDKPGKLFFKEYHSSTEQSIQLLRNPAMLPPAVPPVTVRPQGLSQERKQYLYREIRQFCKPGTEELVAPAP